MIDKLDYTKKIKSDNMYPDSESTSSGSTLNKNVEQPTDDSIVAVENIPAYKTVMMSNYEVIISISGETNMHTEGEQMYKDLVVNLHEKRNKLAAAPAERMAAADGGGGGGGEEGDRGGGGGATEEEE